MTLKTRTTSVSRAITSILGTMKSRRTFTYDLDVTFASSNIRTWGERPAWCGEQATKQKSKRSSCSSLALFSHLSDWGSYMKRDCSEY